MLPVHAFTSTEGRLLSQAKYRHIHITHIHTYVYTVLYTTHTQHTTQTTHNTHNTQQTHTHKMQHTHTTHTQHTTVAIRVYKYNLTQLADVSEFTPTDHPSE